MKRNDFSKRTPTLARKQITAARQRIDSVVTKAKVARDLSVLCQTRYSALNSSGKYAALTMEP